MNVGKQVRLFLVDGTPGGMITAEIMNWTGHVVAAPRSDLQTLLERAEAKRTGIYVLLGDDPDGIGGLTAYVGEGDDVSARLRKHHQPADRGGKDFWDRVIIITSKDQNLTKAHARYLESRFIELAHQARRATLTNGTAPDPIRLPEADISDMEQFIEQARIVLPLLGVNIFRAPGAATMTISTTGSTPTIADISVPAAAVGPTLSPIFAVNLPRQGILAGAQEVDGEFTVLKGSLARAELTPSAGPSTRGLREKLIRDGTLAPTPDGALLQFTHSQVFASASAAAGIVTGRSANGRTEWKTLNGDLSYGDWQQRGLGADPASEPPEPPEPR